MVTVLVLSNWLFLSRYASFVLNKYDPHTVPLSWYSPTTALKSGSGDTLPDAGHKTIPADVLRKVSAYASEQNSMGLFIARHGKMELEQYWGGADRETQFNPQSMSKTLVAMLVGIAIEEGDIKSVDDLISLYMDELKNDPRGDISIRNLLHMSGGLEQIARNYSPVPWSRGVRQHFGTNFNHWILQLELLDEPGTKFDYNNNENNLLAWVLERATGKAYPDYLSEKLWVPLELGAASMYLDKEGGDTMKSCCVFSRPIDWVKLGQLLLDRGQFKGRQLIPADWVDAMLTPAPTSGEYGYQIWLAPITLRGGYIGEEIPPSSYMWWASEPFAGKTFGFIGFGFHHVWVLPELDMVVVRANSKVWPQTPWDQSRIPNILYRHLNQTGQSK